MPQEVLTGTVSDDVYNLEILETPQEGYLAFIPLLLPMYFLSLIISKLNYTFDMRSRRMNMFRGKTK